MFATLGRQLHKERLLHGTSGSFSLLSTTSPGLIHTTRQGAALGLMNEQDLITGRLGDAAPNSANEDWQIHSVALSIASLEHEGRGACVHVAAPYTTTLSLEKDRYALVPTDFEGRSNFGTMTWKAIWLRLQRRSNRLGTNCSSLADMECTLWALICWRPGAMLQPLSTACEFSTSANSRASERRHLD